MTMLVLHCKLKVKPLISILYLAMLYYCNFCSEKLQPRQRITAIEALQHRYFVDLPRQLYELPEG